MSNEHENKQGEFDLSAERETQIAAFWSAAYLAYRVVGLCVAAGKSTRAALHMHENLTDWLLQVPLEGDDAIAVYALLNKQLLIAEMELEIAEFKRKYKQTESTEEAA